MLGTTYKKLDVSVGKSHFCGKSKTMSRQSDEMTLIRK